MLDETRRTISLEDVDLELFESSYKELLQERREGEKIEILFNASGMFTGHIWQQGSLYSLSDLARNGDYVLDDDSYAGLFELILAWSNAA